MQLVGRRGWNGAGVAGVGSPRTNGGGTGNVGRIDGIVNVDDITDASACMPYDVSLYSKIRNSEYLLVIGLAIPVV